MTDPITSEFDRQLKSEQPIVAKGKIAEMAARYDFEGPRLFGLPLKLDFAACDIATTCDAWKRKCAGAPRGAFVLLRLDPEAEWDRWRSFAKLSSNVRQITGRELLENSSLSQ